MKTIPLTRPLIGAEETRAATEVLASGWLTQGPRTAAFEEAVAAATGSRFAIAANSCTTALEALLRSLGIGPGDEVIVPSLSFVATANVVLARGATPVFGDIDLATYNLDPGGIEALVTRHTRCIMPVDQMGVPCALEEILEIAAAHGITVVQDAACALGSEYRGRPVGSGCLAACFSFHPRKVVTTGEGGMVVTDDPDLAAAVRSVVSHGASVDEIDKHRSKKAIYVDHDVLGSNYRLSDVLGAVGAAQMRRLPEIVARRNQLAELYAGLLADEPRLRPPSVPAGSKSNFQSYCVRLDGASRHQRDEVVTRLRGRGVQCTPGIQAIHRYALYRDRCAGLELPRTELAADTTLIIPLFPQMTQAQAGTVATELLAAVRELL